jgi:calcineurin-binding protein cabin-1
VSFSVKHVLDESDQVFRCFEQCLLLNPNHTLLRIEFGSFAYIVNSFCSRNLKLASDTLSMEMFELVEKKKDKCFEIAHQCFSAAIKAPASNADDEDSDEETQDERWLFYYMLGKISEKRKEAPEIWLEVYCKSAKTLYESNATYPIKINHSSPSNLSIEALEIYYRISSGIIKYLEQHATVTKKLLKYFNKVLKELSTSPFAINRAKVNGELRIL